MGVPVLMKMYRLTNNSIRQYNTAAAEKQREYMMKVCHIIQPKQYITSTQVDKYGKRIALKTQNISKVHNAW